MNPQLAFLIGLFIVIVALVLTRRQWAPAAVHAVPSVWRIAKITVAEARRRRVIQAVVILVVLILISMTFFSYLSPQEQSRMLISGGLAAITVFGILLAIFIAAFLIPQELESRTVYAILAKPVRRFEFVLGKYVGALIILAAIVATMTVVLVGVLMLQDSLVQDLPDSAFNPNLKGVVFAAIMNYFAIAVLTGLIILISTVASTTMTVISAFIIWAVGSLQSTISDLAAHAELPVTKALLTVVYLIVPKLENFDFRNEVSNFVPISYGTGWEAVIQGIGYTAVVLILASIFFNDRQV
ncbi:MAG TPA: ABC transporter permease subunit [Armatimonadota bacterium]|nr:ABC transporter permease subunit [Armatimonadota bacterium]